MVVGQYGRPLPGAFLAELRRLLPAFVHLVPPLGRQLDDFGPPGVGQFKLVLVLRQWADGRLLVRPGLVHVLTSGDTGPEEGQRGQQGNAGGLSCGRMRAASEARDRTGPEGHHSRRRPRLPDHWPKPRPHPAAQRFLLIGARSSPESRFKG
jgi:hypothetical protein